LNRDWQRASGNNGAIVPHEDLREGRVCVSGGACASTAGARIAYGIPERYLVQILSQLKGAGLVASTRGAAGGYRLARAATSISLAEVLVAVDGPDVPRRNPSATNRPTTSVLTSVWESVRAAERVVLDHTTIAQLAEQSSPHEWII
jgi:Rrf2 family transcriptional regulator, cysteine metabolism repressor